MSSDGLSSSLALAALEKKFLMASKVNTIEALESFNMEFSQLLLEVEHAASSNNLIPNHEAIFAISHDVYISSSLAAEAESELDDIRKRFSEKISLLPLPTASIPSATTIPIAENISPEHSSSSSCPYTILKQWSLLHMSHLYPSKQQLDDLAAQTSMTPDQVKLWFRNARTRSGWAKLVAHSQINKEPARFEALLLQYQSLVDHRDSDIFKLSFASDERLQLLDNVIQWFTPEAGKQNKHLKPDSIKPWIKEILNNAMDTLKTTSAGLMDSSRQFLSSKKRARISKSTHTPSPSPQPSTSAQHIPRPPSQTSDLSMSPASTTGSFSPTESLPFVGFPPYLGAISDESSPRDPPQDFFSPASSSSSHQNYMEPSPTMAPNSLPGSTSSSSYNLMDPSPLLAPCSLPGSTSSSPYNPTETSLLLEPWTLPSRNTSISTSSPRRPTPTTPGVPATRVLFHNGFDELLQLPANQSSPNPPLPVSELDGFDFSAVIDNPLETSTILPGNSPNTLAGYDFLSVMPDNLGTVGGFDFPTFPPDHLRNTHPPLASSTYQPSFSSLATSFPNFPQPFPPGSNPQLSNPRSYNDGTQPGTQPGNNNGYI